MPGSGFGGHGTTDVGARESLTPGYVLKLRSSVLARRGQILSGWGAAALAVPAVLGSQPLLWGPALALAVVTWAWPMPWSGQWRLTENGQLEQVVTDQVWQLQQPALLTPWLLVVRVQGPAASRWLWCWQDQLSAADWARLRRVSLNLAPVREGSAS